jgi:hypothetical protein
MPSWVCQYRWHHRCSLKKGNTTMDSLGISHPAVNSMCLFILSTVRLDALWLPDPDIFSTLPCPLALLPGPIVMMRFPFHQPGPIFLLPSTPPLWVAVADVWSGLLVPSHYFFLKPHLPGRLQATANGPHKQYQTSFATSSHAIVLARR